MARLVLTGDKQIEATLKKLSDKGADKIATAAVRAGLNVISAGIRKESPKGETGTLKKSIGSRFEKKTRRTTTTAKAGIGVGKRKRSEKDVKRIIRAPHGHLVALGTAQRTRKTIGGAFRSIVNPTPEQLSTGTMPSDPFVKRGYEKAKAKAAAKMKARAAMALEKVAAESRK